MRAAESPTVVIARHLRQAAIFASLSEPDLIHLASACHLRQVEKGTLFFLQGEPAENAFYVVSGSVAIVLYNEDGRELIINNMLPGDLFGELALLTGGLRSSGAMARQECSVIVLPRQAFLEALETEPGLLRSLLDTTAQRLSSSSTRESALAFLDAPARLARILFELDRLEGAGGSIRISQDELARRAGMTRQTAAAILGRWRRLGWLATRRGNIQLLAPGELEKQAEASAHRVQK